jgi:hypothetical protein
MSDSPGFASVFGKHFLRSALNLRTTASSKMSGIIDPGAARLCHAHVGVYLVYPCRTPDLGRQSPAVELVSLACAFYQPGASSASPRLCD